MLKMIIASAAALIMSCSTALAAETDEINNEFLSTLNSNSVSVTREYNEELETEVLTFRNFEKEVLLSADIANDAVYTTVALNMRPIPTLESDVLKVAYKGTKLTRIADANYAWDVVIDEDKNIYFVWDKYLTAEAPTQDTYTETSVASSSPARYTPSYFRQMGVINWGGWRWTWYSQRVLPGGGLRIPGRHVDSNGYVCDENNYICLASGRLPKGTVVDTPFGKKGKVYDCGCAANTLDVYCNW